MKKTIASLTYFFVMAAGVIVVSQAASFGWYSEEARAGSVLKNHSELLIAVGIGLFAVGLFIRHSSRRISALEEQLARLQQKNN